MFSRILTAWALLIVVFVPCLAGIRGPGNYAGVVVFDRWGTCYLFSGVYLMYVSSPRASGLKAYAGKPIVLNAKEVSQPINPGDGLISSYQVVGKPTVNPHHPEARVLELVLEGAGQPPGGGDVELLVRNKGATAVHLGDTIGLALFGPKGRNSFSPSDGASDAWVTRGELETHEWGEEGRWHIAVQEQDVAQLAEELPAGASVSVHLRLKLPPGQYNLLCGYGGNVHEYYCSASNLLPITVGENGAVSFR
jgi:hypothetical protein